MKKGVILMKWFLAAIVITGFILLSGSSTVTYHICPVNHVKAEVPSYAKWGNLAMQKTKEKYPNANIIDYQHLGRTQGTKTNIEKFKLWLKVPNKEFGVIVSITFDKDTEKLMGITFKEVAR